ncbi:MAG: hypothetical protein ACR2PM_19780 [Hyphomicrobiales bacterium]
MIRMLILLLLIFAPAPAMAQAPAEPVLNMELEKASAIPGQPITMRIKILVPTWMPKPPDYPSFEIPNVIVRLPPRASGPVSERIGTETWSGVTRAYRLYPMTVGVFRLPPLPLTVTYADPETRKPVTVTLRTNPVEIAGIAPEGAEDLDPFLAAEALELDQTVEGQPGELEPGGAVTRIVRVEIEGTSPMFVPPLIPSFPAEGLAAYPKEPVVNETAVRGAVSGDRVERVTYVAEAGGRHNAPPIRLRWYNLKEQKIETAEAPGFEIAVRGPPPAKPSTFDWRQLAPWIALGAVLLVAACLTAVKLWPRIAAWRRRRHEAYLASEDFAFDCAAASLKAHSFPRAIRDISVWISRAPPASGGEDARLADAMADLGAAFYGNDPQPPTHGPWSNAVTALHATRREHLAAAQHKRTRQVLPALNPGHTP